MFAPPVSVPDFHGRGIATPLSFGLCYRCPVRLGLPLLQDAAFLQLFACRRLSSSSFLRTTAAIMSNNALFIAFCKFLACFFIVSFWSSLTLASLQITASMSFGSDVLPGVPKVWGDEDGVLHFIPLFGAVRSWRSRKPNYYKAHQNVYLKYKTIVFLQKNHFEYPIMQKS